MLLLCVCFQAEDGIRALVRSRGLGDVYKRQLLMIVGLVGAWRARRTGRGSWAALLALPALLVPVVALGLRGGLKAQAGQLYETESAYNYIQVIRQDGCNYLLLNEGQAYHSFYCDGGRVPAISVWSICLLYTSPSPRDRTRSRMPSSA